MAVISVRILGPIGATLDGEPVPIVGHRQLTLFAVLVLSANRAVSSDELVDAVWGGSRAGSSNRLQMAIARLRKALAPIGDGATSRLRTVSGGYLFSLGAGELDSEVFGGLVRDGLEALDVGEPARAAESLDAGLVLWRGGPLAEVAFEGFAQPEIRRLEELRVVALETRVEAHLQLGPPAQLISELESLLAQHPSRERMAGQLMLALYRSGRQHDALEVYQRTRAHLAEVECPRGRGHLIAWVCPTRLEGCGVHAKDASAVSRGVPS
ncbi:MAG: AfsR/SARP family transcriptional regulator [Solirubrobacteraceae bacterium]